MATPSEELAEMDRVIHEPARLALTTALLSCDGADFLFLQKLIGLTKGNLSSHLNKLQTAGIVAITKSGAGRTARTWVALTDEGRAATARHWKRLDQLKHLAENGLPDQAPYEE
ncbi:ArsR family transcriptional regulator [Murinocardiopsis flavida]|uniref:ArsR family transcriptional regulator n=1 Tax=Murinocardiopsis flavida TaxID=645275 RepID=A0A2P8DS36_9ACTN|nr:transcriptional regulator [Murinocardiopsis flavida]PSL00021.1 ArsR family transcriptional regulator [Murinocardiopsis flavida]